MEGDVKQLKYEVFNGGRGLSVKMDELTSVVGNFISRHDEREKAEAEARRNHRWKVGLAASALSVIVAAIVGWVLTLVVPAARAILDEYYKTHPAAMVQHSSADNNETVYAKNQQQISHY